MEFFILLILLPVFILIAIFIVAFIFYDLKNNFKSKVFFVPSQIRVIKEFFNTYPFQKNRKFYDLGSGDGRIVFLAEKVGLKAYGIENNSALYFLSKILKATKKSEAIFIKGDLRKANIEEADYIYLYLTPKFLKEIENNIFLKLKDGAKVITYRFKFYNRQPKEIYLEKFYIYEK